MSSKFIFIIISIAFVLLGTTSAFVKFKPDYFKNTVYSRVPERCPLVKATRNFNVDKIVGPWYVIQYYESSEEAVEFSCMRCNFMFEDLQITMNFTYKYRDDPDQEKLRGNITWIMPDLESPAHWIHAEYIYEGVYNTYVLDTDYESWMLIMHCAEKEKSPRYLSALLLSRESSLGANVITYLREKLTAYDIDMNYLFFIPQENCEVQNAEVKIGDDASNSQLFQ